MTSEPLVSVVMSVFNGASGLESTLRSILDQTGVEFEFVIVDDGSVDASASILERAAASDARVRVLRQENLGLTRALVRGCAQARGEFIARQDCGDRSLPGRLRRQAAALQENPCLSFVSCGTRYVDPDGEPLYEHAGNAARGRAIAILDVDAPHGVLDGPTHHGSVMFRRDAYLRTGGYRPQFYFGQDWDLWYRLAEQGDFLVLPEYLLEVGLAAGDISSRFKGQQEALARLSRDAARRRARGESETPLLELAARVRPEQRRGSAATAAARGCYFIGECLRRNGRNDKARRYFLQALRSDPLYLRAWLRLVQSYLSTSQAAGGVR
jgi:glycosyltransferase involved in cell wall biosynthesis